MNNTFGSGMAYPFRALGRILSDRRLWGYVLVPLVLNLVLGVLLYGVLLNLGFGWIDGLSERSSLGGALEAVLRVVLVVGLFVGVGFVLVRFGVLLGSPWYSNMSERIERAELGSAPPAEPLTPAGIARDLGRALGFELRKLVIVLVVGLLLLLVNLIPVAGQAIGTVGSVVLGAFIACLDFFDGPLERRRLRFREKVGYARQNMPASAGFGLACFALISIPLLNLLLIPVCVAAGTLFFCQRPTAPVAPAAPPAR